MFCIFLSQLFQLTSGHLLPMWCSPPPDFKLLSFVQFPSRRRRETSSTSCVAAWWKKGWRHVGRKQVSGLGMYLGDMILSIFQWICFTVFCPNFLSKSLRSDFRFSSRSLQHIPVFTFSAHMKNFWPSVCEEDKQVQNQMLHRWTEQYWTITDLISQKLPPKGHFLGRCCWSTHWYKLPRRHIWIRVDQVFIDQYPHEPKSTNVAHGFQEPFHWQSPRGPESPSLR